MCYKNNTTKYLIYDLWYVLCTVITPTTNFRRQGDDLPAMATSQRELGEFYYDNSSQFLVILLF